MDKVVSLFYLAGFVTAQTPSAPLEQVISQLDSCLKMRPGVPVMAQIEPIAHSLSQYMLSM